MNFAITLLTIFPTGTLETPIVIALQSTRRSAAGTNGTLNGNDAVSLISVGSQIFRIPKDMLAGIDRRQILRESQKTLHAVLKPEMAKLCQALHLSVSGFFRLCNLLLAFAYTNCNWSCYLISCYSQT